jgi:hypothetical protein
MANRPPGTADEYEFPTPEGLPVDQGLLDSFKAAAHDMGLSQEQMGKFASWYGDLSLKQAGMVRQQQEMADWAERAELGRLREEWGLRDFDARKDRAVKQASKVFDERTVKFFGDAGFFSDPMFLRGLDAIAEAVSDDAFVEGRRTGENQQQRSPGGAPMLRYDNSPTMRKG